jgi:hypothetical protein
MQPWSQYPAHVALTQRRLPRPSRHPGRTLLAHSPRNHLTARQDLL